MHLDSKAVQEQQRSTGNGSSRSSGEVLGASPRPPGQGSSHMDRPGQQAVARRDPGELERLWRGVLSRWRLVDERIFSLNSGGLYIPGRLSVAQIHTN